MIIKFSIKLTSVKTQYKVDTTKSICAILNWQLAF